jgi:NTP pyrophosphatase (non-canonical NTP hydrolase)
MAGAGVAVGRQRPVRGDGRTFRHARCPGRPQSRARVSAVAGLLWTVVSSTVALVSRVGWVLLALVGLAGARAGVSGSAGYMAVRAVGGMAQAAAGFPAAVGDSYADLGADEHGGTVDIRFVQELAWDNQKAKGFNTTDVPLEFGLLTPEVGEAFTAWRKRLSDLGEELADILIYLAGLAQMTGIDLSTEVERKLAKNSDRIYETDARGWAAPTTLLSPPNCREHAPWGNWWHAADRCDL